MIQTDWKNIKNLIESQFLSFDELKSLHISELPSDSLIWLKSLPYQLPWLKIIKANLQADPLSLQTIFLLESIKSKDKKEWKITVTWKKTYTITSTI